MSRSKIPSMITDSNQVCFVKMIGRRVQEGSDATYFMEIKGLAKEKKIKMSPSILISSYSSKQV